MSRLGYICRRHVEIPESTLTDYEKKIKLDTYVKEPDRKKRKKHQERSGSQKKRPATETLCDIESEKRSPSKRERLESGSDASRQMFPSENQDEYKDTINDCAKDYLTRDYLIGAECHQISTSSASPSLDMNSSNQTAGQNPAAAKNVRSCSKAGCSSETNNDLEKLQLPEHSIPNPDKRPESGLDTSVQRPYTQPYCSVPHSTWDFNAVQLPDISNRDKLELSRPNEQLLPCCIQLAKSKYTYDVRNLRNQRPTDRDGDYLNFSFGQAGWKSSVNVMK